MVLFHPASTWHDAFDTRAYMQREHDGRVAPAIGALVAKCSDWVELNIAIQSIREASLEVPIILLLPVVTPYKDAVTLHLPRNCKPLSFYTHRNEGEPLVSFTSNSTVGGCLLSETTGLRSKFVAPLCPDPTIDRYGSLLDMAVYGKRPPRTAKSWLPNWFGFSTRSVDTGLHVSNDRAACTINGNWTRRRS